MSGIKENRKVIMELIAPVAESYGLALLDVLYVHEGGRTVLRLIIDKKGGIGIGDCELVSEKADLLISDGLGFEDFDVFEVSSPGLDRPLNTVEDCIRHEGEWARISLYRGIDGVKRFYGSLVVEYDSVGVITESGDRMLFSWDDIAQVKREIVF